MNFTSPEIIYTKAEKKKFVIQKYEREKARGLVHTPEWEEFIKQELEWLERYEKNKEEYGD